HAEGPLDALPALVAGGDGVGGDRDGDRDEQAGGVSAQLLGPDRRLLPPDDGAVRAPARLPDLLAIERDREGVYVEVGRDVDDARDPPARLERKAVHGERR